MLEGIELKRPIRVKIEGCIYTNNGDNIKNDEFLNAFIEIVENKGWSFQIDEEGNQINDIE